MDKHFGRVMDKYYGRIRIGGRRNRVIDVFLGKFASASLKDNPDIWFFVLLTKSKTIFWLLMLISRKVQPIAFLIKKRALFCFGYLCKLCQSAFINWLLAMVKNKLRLPPGVSPEKH